MLKRATMQLAQGDQHIRGDRWRPLVRWLYQAMAPIYDAGAGLLVPDYQLAAVELLERLGVTPHDRVVDLGCGTGMVTLPAAERAGCVVGLDMTPAMLRRLQRKSGRQPAARAPALIQGDARRLPLADGSCSIVTTSFMLLHLTTAEKQQVFREVHRVLAPDGRFGCLTSRHSIGDAYPTRGEWRGWLTEAGFDGMMIADVRDVYRLVLATGAPAHGRPEQEGSYE